MERSLWTGRAISSATDQQRINNGANRKNIKFLINIELSEKQQKIDRKALTQPNIGVRKVLLKLVLLWWRVRNIINLDRGTVGEILSSIRKNLLCITMYGVNEAVIIASLAIPAELFIWFSTILVIRLRQCM